MNLRTYKYRASINHNLILTCDQMLGRSACVELAWVNKAFVEGPIF